MSMRLAKVARRFVCNAVRSVRVCARSRDGGALVETALAMPLLIAMLIGAAEFGMAMYTAVEVANAATAGVQYGALKASNSGDTVGIQRAAANDAPDITLATPVVSHSCVCSDGSSSTCLATDCSSSHPETILTVETQTTFSPGFTLPGLPTSFTIHGRAVQKVLQ